MIKPQDCLVLLKLIANKDNKWPQRKLALTLCISLSEINACLKRLLESGLIMQDEGGSLLPNLTLSEEFLIHCMKFLFPTKFGEYTLGVPTAVASPLFYDKIARGRDPLPVWPDTYGSEMGVAIKPIYPSVPQALREHPDQNLYELLTLVDAIRSGRARERNIAIKLIKEKIYNENKDIT